jgi:uncharacterized protein YodC (DUF2158 family)
MGTDKIVDGDVVKLKSGGPDMTVEHVHDESRGDQGGNGSESTVAWFAEAELRRATLRTASLRKKKAHKA